MKVDGIIDRLKINTLPRRHYNIDKELRALKYINVYSDYENIIKFMLVSGSLSCDDIEKEINIWIYSQVDGCAFDNHIHKDDSHVFEILIRFNALSIAEKYLSDEGI